MISKPGLSEPASSELVHADSGAPMTSKVEPIQIEGSGVPKPVRAEIDMPESTSGLAASEPIHVEVQQAEAMVTEPTVKKLIPLESFPEKPVVDEQMLEQVLSAALQCAKSTETMAVESAKPMSQEREVAPSKLRQFAIEVQASTLEGEDIRAEISLLEDSLAASSMYLEDIHMEPQ